MARGPLEPLINHLLRIAGDKYGGRLSDAQLVERFVDAGDSAAFESLMWRHGPMVLGLCQQMLHHRQDAEDAFQAVFLVFVRKARTISRREAVASWLYKVAMRIALKARETARRRGKTEELEQVAAAAQADQGEELRPMLDEALQYLPEKYRAPIVLHYLQGKTVQQVAEEMGCPSGTVAGRLNRAKEMLRRRLLRRGVTLSSAAVAAILIPQSSRAALPAALVARTLEAARAFASHSAAASVSVSASALAESTLRGLTVARYKVALLLVVVLGLSGVGAGTLARRILVPAPQPETIEKNLVTATPREPPPKPKERRDDKEGSLPKGALARLGSDRFQHGGFIHALALSADGATVASAGQGKGVYLWDADGGRPRRVCVTPSAATVDLLTVAFAADATRLAAGDARGAIHLWRTDTGQLLAAGQAHQGAVHALRFAPDGKKLVTAGADGAVHLWRIDDESLEMVRTLQGPRRGVRALAFAPDGKTLALGGEDGSICYWEPASGIVRRTWKASRQAIRALAFSSDGETLASAAADKQVVLWNAESATKFLHYDLHPVLPLTLTFVDERRLLVGGEAGLLRMYDIDTHRFLRDFAGFRWAVESLACTRDGRTLFAAGQDSVVGRWSLSSGKEEVIDPQMGHRGAVLCMDRPSRGRLLASAGLDGTLRLWDIQDGRQRRVWQPRFKDGRRVCLCAAAFAPDGRSVAAGSLDGTIYRWQVESERAESWHAHSGRIEALVFAPDGQSLISADKDGNICQWRTATKTKIREFARATGVTRLAVSADGRWLAGADRAGALYLWDLPRGARRHVLPLPGERVESLAFSPRGALLAAAVGNGPLRLWDLADPMPVAVNDGPRGDNIVALAFAPDGRTLALAGRDGVIRFRPLAGGAELGQLSGHRARITGLLFAADGRTLASSSNDGTILIWQVPQSAQALPAPRKEIDSEKERPQ